MRRLVLMSWVLMAGVAAWSSDCAVQGRIVYASPEGSPVKLSLWLPKDSGAAPRPGVVLIHGGCWLFGTRHQLHWYARRLAEHGFAAATISYRMMPTHGFPDCLYDSKAAVRWMRLHASEYGIDPNRIGVLGNSAGGHLAALLATTAPEDGLEGPENAAVSSAVQAAVVMYGVTDLSYYRDPSGYVELGGLTTTFLSFFAGKPTKEGRDPFLTASPLTYAGRNTCPVLLVHGTRDNLVPYAQSVAFCEQLRRLGVTTRLIAVPYGHAFDFFHRDARKQAFDEILGFLKKQLGN